MEFLIMILETIGKFGAGLSTSALLALFLGVLLYFFKDNAKYRKITDDKMDSIHSRIDDVFDAQEEMKEEYREGFTKINRDLIQQHQDTQETLTQLKEQQLENQRLTLRGLVTNISLPDEYRMNSYDKYKELGGNSWLDRYVNEKLASKTEEQD